LLSDFSVIYTGFLKSGNLYKMALGVKKDKTPSYDNMRQNRRLS
jgi:hypothetical protein